MQRIYTSINNTYKKKLLSQMKYNQLIQYSVVEGNFKSKIASGLVLFCNYIYLKEATLYFSFFRFFHSGRCAYHFNAKAKRNKSEEYTRQHAVLATTSYLHAREERKYSVLYQNTQNLDPKGIQHLNIEFSMNIV